MVWDSVCNANFKLRFKNTKEYSFYTNLHVRMHLLCKEVSQKYLDKFEALEEVTSIMKTFGILFVIFIALFLLSKMRIHVACSSCITLVTRNGVSISLKRFRNSETVFLIIFHFQGSSLDF